jgi:hypothetical protein
MGSWVKMVIGYVTYRKSGIIDYTIHLIGNIFLYPLFILMMLYFVSPSSEDFKLKSEQVTLSLHHFAPYFLV